MVSLVLGFRDAGAADSAASPCKGLAQDVCQSNTICSWVKGHGAKKGTETASYCRKKPSRAKVTPANAKE
jgi:hypothetical protein